MVNGEHLAILKKGVEVWDKWRKEHPSVKPDLSGAILCDTDLLVEADLSGADLTGAMLRRSDLRRTSFRRANLSGADLGDADLMHANLRRAKIVEAELGGALLMEADLRGADLSMTDFDKADLCGADLSGADLTGASFSGADLSGADFRGANLKEAYLGKADLSYTDLSGADLTGAYLSGAIMIETKLNNKTILTGCAVFGISAWGLKGLEEAKQSDLVITPHGKPVITVDNLEIAQFIYLLLRSEKIRGVIDAISSKAVLILGRFTSERKAILDAIREELRKRNYLPILFDFGKPARRNLTETVSTLAHMARFVIADITNAKSIPQELQRIVPDLPSVPVQPILLSSAKEYAMFEDFTRYPWVLNIYRYDNTDDLLKAIEEKIISPAENKVKVLQRR